MSRVKLLKNLTAALRTVIKRCIEAQANDPSFRAIPAIPWIVTIENVRLISPERTAAPDDPEYQGNIEERHDNAAEHSNYLNYPHTLYGSISL